MPVTKPLILDAVVAPPLGGEPGAPLVRDPLLGARRSELEAGMPPLMASRVTPHQPQLLPAHSLHTPQAGPVREVFDVRPATFRKPLMPTSRAALPLLGAMTLLSGCDGVVASFFPYYLIVAALVTPFRMVQLARANRMGVSGSGIDGGAWEKSMGSRAALHFGAGAAIFVAMNLGYTDQAMDFLMTHDFFKGDFWQAVHDYFSVAGDNPYSPFVNAKAYLAAILGGAVSMELVMRYVLHGRVAESLSTDVDQSEIWKIYGGREWKYIKYSGAWKKMDFADRIYKTMNESGFITRLKDDPFVQKRWDGICEIM